jgi:phosphoribosylanthranilate isomerase
MALNTLIKICGITNLADACTAVEAGAHALGFVFYEPSSRCISYRQAREIIYDLPPFVVSVAVLVNHSIRDTSELLDAVPVNVLQLHGDENPELCEAYGFPYIKAIRARSVLEAGGEAHRYPGARAFLFDTLVHDQYGGTGEPIAWQPLPSSVGKPVILAGGLAAENVADAIRTVRPYAVDVSSGVETSKGVKDSDKVRRFIQAVRSADIETSDQQSEI